MYIAMNRFKVKKGAERDFEQVWLSRETHLENVPGFIVFHLLKGPEREDHVLYASHSFWRSEKHFSEWTRSEAFRKAMKAPVSTSRFISDIPNSKALQFCKRSRLTPKDAAE